MKIMKKRLILGLIIGLLMISTIPFAIGTSEIEKQNTAICEFGDYNLYIKIYADRRISPRIYSEGVFALFRVDVWNDGPDDSEECILNCSITRIIGGNSEGIRYEDETIIQSHEADSALGHMITHFCNNYGFIHFGAYRIQAGIDCDDNKLSDNSASFIFVVLHTHRIFLPHMSS
jgi:hypothetical protein